MNAIIPLTRGLVTLVDKSDRALVEQSRWKARPATSTGGGSCGFYACKSRSDGGKDTTIYLHRFLMGATRGQIVDHINGDKLDNRRANLRFCTASENASNRAFTSASGFRGVHRRQFRWVALITVSGSRFRIGSFATAQEAAKAYDAAAQQHFGRYAILNFGSVQ